MGAIYSKILVQDIIRQLHGKQAFSTFCLPWLANIDFDNSDKIKPSYMIICTVLLVKDKTFTCGYGLFELGER